MNNYKLHRDLGSALNGIITLAVFMIVLKALGDFALYKFVISFIAASISYPLVGLTLRGTRIWKK